MENTNTQLRFHSARNCHASASSNTHGLPHHSQLLTKGNQLADLGTYTRTDGSAGSAMNDGRWNIAA
ncbi:MAG: hypothetical protein PHY62_00230 [Gallionella sp.]|nr:hypothetical protein [Gallionella sp.]